MVIIDDPDTAAFTPGAHAPAAFAHAPGTPHDGPMFRASGNKGDEVLALLLRHPRGGTALKFSGFDHGDKPLCHA